MNRKQVAAMVIGMLLLLTILVWPGALVVGEVVSRVPAGPDSEVVVATVDFTPTTKALLALAGLSTVAAVIRVRNRAAS